MMKEECWVYTLFQNKRKEYQAFLDEALEMLENSSFIEWRERYKKYIDEINTGYHASEARFIRRIVKIEWPLAAYIRITDMTHSGINLDIRLMGTSVATLNVATRELTTDERYKIKKGIIDDGLISKGNSIVTVSFKGKENGFNQLAGIGSAKNKQVIDSQMVESGVWNLELINELLQREKWGWHDKKLTQFRSMVNKVYKNGGFRATNEHAYESNLLHLMKGNCKHFYCMKPVTLENSFFQMPTPFMGSEAKKGILYYAYEKGGGIDILARKKYGAQNELCVIELKDNYEEGEEPIKAIKQAIAYSAFIIKLLESESGDDWYKYFKMNSTSEKCNINAIISMPFDKGIKTITKDEDDFFKDMVLDAGNGRTVTLHYLYFSEDIFYSKAYYEEDVKTSLKRDRF